MVTAAARHWAPAAAICRPLPTGSTDLFYRASWTTPVPRLCAFMADAIALIERCPDSSNPLVSDE